MSSKGYFILGCKLFGIYCLLLGVPTFVNAAYTFINVGGVPSEISRAYFFTNTMLRLIPVLLVGGGLYMLGKGEAVYNFAYPDEEEYGDEFEKIFVIAVKILGIFLIVNHLPDLLKNIAKFVTKMTAPEVFQVFTQQQFDLQQTVYNSCGVVLGFYLLRSGKWFIKYGLKKS